MRHHSPQRTRYAPHPESTTTPADPARPSGFIPTTGRTTHAAILDNCRYLALSYRQDPNATIGVSAIWECAGAIVATHGVTHPVRALASRDLSDIRAHMIRSCVCEGSESPPSKPLGALPEATAAPASAAGGFDTFYDVCKAHYKTAMQTLEVSKLVSATVACGMAQNPGASAQQRAAVANIARAIQTAFNKGCFCEFRLGGMTQVPPPKKPSPQTPPAQHSLFGYAL